jgi:AcrR family transcriptional regulator
MKVNTRKEEILITAAKLFNEKGFTGVSVRDIADAMNIKAASLYYHIENKQEMLAMIIISVAEKFIVGMNEIVDSDLSPSEKIEKFIALHIDLTIKYRYSIACLNKDWMHLEGANLPYFQRMRSDYERNFRNILKQGIKSGELKDINVEILLFSILSTLRTLYLWYSEDNEVPQQDLTEQMTKALLKGVLNFN